MSEESRKHNSHAAESWRELAGDVRQWADGHRLAITATVALVVLNLVVWLVVAMAGFAFPLRLDTSMAEFDFGKLFCTLFLARGLRYQDGVLPKNVYNKRCYRNHSYKVAKQSRFVTTEP